MLEHHSRQVFGRLEKKNFPILNFSKKQTMVENPVTTLRGGDLVDVPWRILAIWYAVNNQALVEGFTSHQQRRS